MYDFGITYTQRDERMGGYYAINPHWILHMRGESNFSEYCQSCGWIVRNGLRVAR